jgi:ATP-dependent DNA ligase
VPAKSASGLLPGTDLRLSRLSEEEPRFVRKMDCVAVDRVDRIPSGTDWLREIKWDGYRVCVAKTANCVAIRTKMNLPPSARYKHIEKSLEASALPDCVFDGELVVRAVGQYFNCFSKADVIKLR